MNRIILFEISRKLKAKPRLVRKVKIFAVVGIVGFLITSALMIWTGVSAIKQSANR